ncbi:hypothetical protein K6119_09750 [Paracrocinitomix mangrovi]|uniref:hypothetical protein n=1 Tax=Paracrocinitomix mangrovi TaxID=2862509 RepID=UPI001C8E1F22|nr:hypothetical protein [Paracrocinitomix mangrovi]UKN03773.1 hypothetical protein K6119_09750 [Paracrocinitomix mangrovi]
MNRILLFILLLPNIGNAQSKNFILFEDSFWARGLYYTNLDSFPINDFDKILEPSKRKNLKNSDCAQYYRFWVIKNNQKNEHFAYCDSTDFDYKSIQEMFKPVKILKQTFNYNKKSYYIDSLRRTNTPFYYDDQASDKTHMVEFESYFKPEEFSPWGFGPERLNWIVEHKDSLMNLIVNAYDNVKLSDIVFTAADGPYKKGAHVRLRIYLNDHYWKMDPIMDCGYYPISSAKVVDREYTFYIAVPRNEKEN